MKKKNIYPRNNRQKKDDYECTICLENIKLNQDINILKCRHIFHYKCIENLVDHKINRCPNCRCDLKTGEKQPCNQNNNLGLLNDIGEFDLISLPYDEHQFSNENSSEHYSYLSYIDENENEINISFNHDIDYNYYDDDFYEDE